MTASFFATALLFVSVLTNLTVEGLKKLLDEKGVKYSSNLLAVIISVVIAAAVSGGYMIYTDAAFTAKIGVEIVGLMYGSFLTATVGYDKVMQMIGQIKTNKTL